VRIHALTTGTVVLKQAFLHATSGWRRQPNLLLPGPWEAPVPIHCWAVEHDGRLLLVDTGETADVRDIPFARFHVRPEEELPGVLAAAGLALADVDTVLLTHLHGDHMDGAVHVRGPVLVHEPELRFARSVPARVLQRVLRQPLPAAVQFTPFTLDDGPFGAFPRSRRLTEDGRVVAVDTAGHSPGHVSVICIDDEGRHVLLAGDTTDSLEQLRALRVDPVAPKPAVSIATMRTILAHAAEHPTVYLPAHDLESAARLEASATL
jgi:N-acyl homoserine lactone hydrolase